MEKTRIVIENDQVKIFDEIGKGKKKNPLPIKTVSVEALISSVRKQKMEGSNVKTPLLLPGTRYYFRNRDLEIVVMEERPQVRTIEVSGKGEYLLAFPYIVYIFCLVEGMMPDYRSRIFYRAKPLTSHDDQLFACNLTHALQGANQDLLFGAACMKAGIESRWPLAEKISANMAYYWQTQFCDPSNWNGFFQDFSKLAEKDIRMTSWESWQEMSKKNPLFVLDIPWLETKLTLRQAIKETCNKFPQEGAARPLNDIEDIEDILYRLGEA